MSNDDLRSRLNAKIKAEKDQNQQASAEQQKLAEVATREVPRLTNDLIARVESILNGVNELTIDHSENLHVMGAFGNYIVPIIKITFRGSERIVFRPGGFGSDGAESTIAIVTKGGGTSRYDNIGMIRSKADPERWFLAVKNKGSGSSPWLELTDKILEGLLGDALDA